MSGLNLISTYSSDSDDEQEQQKDKKDEEKINDRSRNSLPLPSSILSWQGVDHHQEVIDDPLQHGGRVRSFKHERGNWATLVYIDYVPSDEMRRWMNSTLEQISSISEDNTLLENLHVSLSRTSVLKFHWIESFVDSLRKLCQRTSRFMLEPTSVKVYRNEEKTRTFLGIHCCNADGILERFTQELDELLAEYQLPPFYENASHHISFLWCLGDKEESLKRIEPSLTDSFNEFLAEHTTENGIEVNVIHCKIGNKLYLFQLR